MHTPTTDAVRRRRNTLAAVGLAAIGLFVVALVVLHAAAGQGEPAHLSEFAHSRFGMLWALSVYTFILGGAMVVWALRPALPDCPSKLAGLSMLGLAAVGAALLATFPIDEYKPVSWVGRIHIDATLATFSSLGAAMVVLAPSFRNVPGLSGLAPVSAALGVMVTASWLAYLVTTWLDIGVYAPVQRILVALIAVWFAAVAWRLRAHEPVPPPVLAEAEAFVAVKRRKAAPQPVRRSRAKASGARKARAPGAVRRLAASAGRAGPRRNGPATKAITLQK